MELDGERERESERADLLVFILYPEHARRRNLSAGEYNVHGERTCNLISSIVYLKILKAIANRLRYARSSLPGAPSMNGVGFEARGL